MRKIREILRLRHERGLSHRQIARAVAVGAGTVGEYLAKAASTGLSWPIPEELDDASLERVLFPPPPASSEREVPDFAAMHEELSRHRELTLMQLWVEYAEDNSRAYRYSRYCELYHRWKKKLKPTMRQRHRAGEKTFVDFSGKRPQVVDPETGEGRPVELFVAALGASSYTFAYAVEDQSLASWVKAHEEMASYFGGSTELWVPDNLKSGVVWADRYEPGINRTYQELASHYGAVVIPARVGRPKDKAKVESAVQVTQRWILAVLRNQTFFSLAALNAAIREQLERLNARPMPRLGASRRELYERLDRPALKPLPIGRYELAEWKPCTVGLDYHVDVDGSHYSVPYQLVDERVEVRTTASMVEVMFRDKRVASHQKRKTKGELVTESAHMPASHRRYLEWTPSRLTHWASQNGPATGSLVTEILRRKPHPEQGYRASLGLMRLGRRFTGERLEAACRRALSLGSYSYRTVKNILSAGLDRTALDEHAETSPRPTHENIRGAAYYDVDGASC